MALKHFGNCAPLCCFLILAACVAATPPPRYVSRIGEEPTAGSSSEARVGDPIYVKFDYRSEEVLKLTQPVEQKYPGCFGCVVSVPPGALLNKGTANELCTRESYPLTGRGGGSGRASVICFTAHATRDAVIQFRVPGTLGHVVTLTPPIPFERVEAMVGGEGFKSELVYQGVANQVLRLLYREYSENLARPAFQQELTYTMETGGPTNVGFRALQIEVLSADNSGIRYRVMSGL